MASSSKIGYPDVPKSVTNPNVNLIDTLDKDGPMSFLQFIKIVSVSYEPDSLQSYYNYYLRLWNDENKNKTTTNENLIIDSYREFLKEINLNYTTPEERQFLTKIDFSDPHDLEVAMSFYGKKLRELARFYNKQREEIKFSTTKSKLKGSVIGTKLTTRDLVVSFLSNYEDGRMLFDLEDVVSKFEIELEELYDTYPIYLNQKPNERIYDYKDLDYGMNLFLTDDDTTISQHFSSFSDELLKLKEVDELLDNKRKLTSKYMSNDWYFLSTGQTTSDYLTGELFKCDNTVKNFINREYPTTASTSRKDYLQGSRERGFFQPHKNSIVLIDGILDSYTVNVSNLKPNTLYFYPDPSKIGINGEVLTFIVDDSYLKRNFSSGSASREPYSNANDTKYYGYVSKLDQNTRKYLDVVFDSGFIQDYKKDIHGNSWGLFKNDHRFRKVIDNDNTDKTIIYKTLQGGEFYDEIFGEGYNFDYTIDTSPYQETLRSGLSTKTSPFSSKAFDLTLFFGYLHPSPTFPSPTESNIKVEYQIIEGGYITDRLGNPLPEAISSESPTFSSSFLTNPSLYYYNTLIDGGIHTGEPLVRATSALSADATQTNRTSALYVVDGGVVGDGFDAMIDFSRTDYYYDDTVLETSQYTLETIPEEVGWELNGKLFIKNIRTGKALELLEAFPALSIKYSPEVVNELENNIISFEMASDTIFIETKTYLVIFKTKYENGEFVDSKEEYHVINHLSNLTGDELITNRYKVGSKVYYTTLLWANPYGNNNIVIYPTIYEYNIDTHKNDIIYTTLSSDLEFLSISSTDITYEDIQSPRLTYSSRNNIYSISMLLKDQNMYPYLHTYDFELKADLNWLNHSAKKFGGTSFSNILSSVSTMNTFLSSTTPSFSNSILTI